MLKIINAYSAEDLGHIRKVFSEYAQSLDFELDFQEFDKEMASLPGDYSPPNGRLLLARYRDQIAGSVALRKLDKGVCEMKRLYVRSRFQRLGIGKALAELIIKEACRIGYTYMRLDTVPSMVNARALYKTLNFKKIKPYRFNPIKGASFMELNLV